MIENHDQSHGLYYTYKGEQRSNAEPERLIHGPASTAECERVRNARLIDVAGVAIEAYVIKPIRSGVKTS